MLGVFAASTALVANGPASLAHGLGSATPVVAYQSAAVAQNRCAEPAMILTPAVRGAVVGGAVVGVISKFLSRETVTTEPGAPVTKAEVTAAQKLWAESIASISKVYAEKGDFVAAAGKLYGYGHGSVLFKPTKATDHPFRATGEEAMTYFVGAEAMKMDEFKGEDAGFAING